MEVLRLWEERSLCQPLPQSTQLPSSNSYVHPATTHGANSVLVAARQNYVCGKVNHVAVEEDQEALDVVIGTFFVNDTSAVVLFDSRALHSFISIAYVEKHNLPIALLRCQVIVSSSKGDMPQGRYARW
jgi:hypothetical protein